MAKSGKYLLGIFFNIAITIFLVLSLLGFISILSEHYRDILIFVILGKWLIEVLLSASRMHEKDNEDKN